MNDEIVGNKAKNTKPYQKMHGDAAQLAVRLRSVIKDEEVVILVSGLGKKHGSNQVAMRLSQSLASLYEHRRVLLIDADIGNSSANEFFEINATKGLAQAILEDTEIADVVNTTQSVNLSILPTVKNDEMHLKNILSSVESQLLDKYKKSYPIIVISGPSDVKSFEFSVWTTHSDQVVLATGEGVRKADVIEAKKSIEEAGSSMAGIVITHYGH
jgi:Mrp family chromosome partitioning ATPase